MDFFKTPHINFMAQRKLAYCISCVVIGAGLVSMVAKGGLKLGIDFTGGTVIQIQTQKKVALDIVRKGLGTIGFNDAAVQRVGESNTIIFKLQQDKHVSQQVINGLEKQINVPITIEKMEIIGPAVGTWLLKRALLALLLSFVGIIIYVAFRFHGNVWGSAGVLALVHDSLVVIGCFSLLDKEITITVVAAVMTITGYSINDTIVIYDRIRENLRMRYKEPLDIVINDSINQTLSRTIITSGVTLFTVTALYFFGGETLKDFSLALIIGMIAGVYSTVYVASPIVYDWKMRNKRK